MSNLLNEAIIDAKMLREAALKNAETAIIEKYSEEVREILMDRIVFELTNPYAENELFIIDGNYYYLIRVPYTGALWDGRYNRSFR